MSMSEDVDSFAAMFSEPLASRRKAREVRVQKERRTQLTDKQRTRSAVRTEQINFRCSPAFKALVHAIKDHMGVSVADALEEALDLLAKAKGLKGGKDA